MRENPSSTSSTYSAEINRGEDDSDTIHALHSLEDREKLQGNRFPGVRKILVVLSSAGLVLDQEALEWAIYSAYPDSAIFFRTTMGKALGQEAPRSVDLLIDLTGPRQRQGLLYALKLRKLAKYAVGRNVGFFRSRYDKVFNEKEGGINLPLDTLDRERLVQKAVLALAGVAVVPAADATADLSKKIALDLPPLQ